MNYEVKINEFEGPLDLLLYLIKESKVNIWDIKIEDITSQYLSYIDAMEQLNLNVASTYLVMAAELIEMKSKLLLPRHEEIEEETEDPREVLIHKLILYQKYKEVTKNFQELEQSRQEIYTKSPDNIKKYLDDDIMIQSDLSLDDLVDALKKFLERKKESRPLHTKVTSKGITIEERRFAIRDVLSRKKKVRFVELFDVVSKDYIIATFLAILEMARKSELLILQDKAFGEIFCEVTG